MKSLLVLLVLLWPGGSSAKESISDSFYLQNGMQVVVIPNHIVPALTHMIWYKIGGAHDPKGQSGIAHVLEHLLFKGTDKLKSGEFSRIIAQHGGNDNAFTAKDYTAYHQSIAKENLELVMQMEADRMRNIRFTEEEFRNELKIVLEERNMRVENIPRNILLEKMSKALFKEHPYGTPTIGWPDEIANLDMEKTLEFYNKYYSPNNALLIVSGDIEAEELKPIAEKYYGSIPVKEVQKSPIPTKLPDGFKTKKIRYSDAGVSSPELIIYIPAPNHKTEHKEHTYPLLLLSHVLGEGNTGLLSNSLVKQRGIAVQASTYYDDISMGPSVFNIHILPVRGKTANQMYKALNEELETLLTNGINNDDLERAKKELVAASIYARDGMSTIANIFGEIAASDIPIEYFDNWEENINSVNLNEMNAALEYLFRESPRVIGTLQPEIRP